MVENAYPDKFYEDFPFSTQSQFHRVYTFLIAMHLQIFQFLPLLSKKRLYDQKSDEVIDIGRILLYAEWQKIKNTKL